MKELAWLMTFRFETRAMGNMARCFLAQPGRTREVTLVDCCPRTKGYQDGVCLSTSTGENMSRAGSRHCSSNKE